MVDGAGNPNFPAAMQPYEQCGLGPLGGCGLPVPRDDCGSAGLPPCGTSGGPAVIGSNTYSSAGTQQTYTGPCRKTGWKNVQAKATWPGIFGFFNSGADCCPTDTPPQFKYTGISYDNNAEFNLNETRTNASDPGIKTIHYSHHFKQDATVDNFGNIARTGFKYSTDAASNDRFPGNPTFNYTHTDNCNGIYAIGTLVSETGPEDLWFEFSLFEGDKFFLYSCNSGTPPTLTPDPGSASWSALGGDAVLTVSNWIQSFSVTNDLITLTIAGQSVKTITSDGSDVPEFGPAGTVFYSRTLNWSQIITIQLTGSYSYAKVQEEIATLLSQWHLSDDDVYPWRTDGKTWKAPVVSRDAGSVGPSLDWTVDGSCNFTQSTPYSGAILGGPNPAGYARYFDYRAKITEPCCPEGLIIRDNNWFCTNGWGEYSASPIPASATQWTNNEDGSLMMEGAWIMQWNGADYIWAQKWAESLEEWPSVNYARPFGRDRFLIDFNNVTGIAECYGTTGIPTADYASDITTDPSDPLYAFRRFPTCRPIGSTIIINSAVQSSPGFITITTAENHWLLPFDSLDFYGVPGLATNVLVSSASPNTNTLVVGGTLSGVYTSGGYVASHYTAFDTWKWDWTCSRHTFVVQQWQTDYRGSGSILYNQYQASLQLAAKTSVIFFSPNIEGFSNGYSAGFGSIAYEPCFDKSQWHGKFLQATPDPFFKAPLQCSGDTGAEHFCQQSAPCASDSDPTCVYYDYPPLVEPMISAPEGSPPLPVSFGFFDSGMPGKAGVNCANPKDIPTIHAIRQAWLDCHAWETVIHKHCISSVDPSTISASRGAGNSIGAGGGSTGL